MELKMCPGCKKVFLADRDRQFCPLCAVIQKSRRGAQRMPASDSQHEPSRTAVAVSQ